MSIENPSGEVSVHRPTNLEDLRSEMPSFIKNMQSRNMCFPKVQEGCTKVQEGCTQMQEGCTIVVQLLCVCEHASPQCILP